MVTEVFGDEVSVVCEEEAMTFSVDSHEVPISRLVTNGSVLVSTVRICRGIRRVGGDDGVVVLLRAAEDSSLFCEVNVIFFTV